MATVEIKGYNFTFHPNTDAPNKYVKGETLSDVYKKWSSAKQRAYDECRKMFDCLNGHGFCISGSNCDTFTVMFDFEHPETGKLMRAKITKCYNHLYYL